LQNIIIFYFYQQFLNQLSRQFVREGVTFHYEVDSHCLSQSEESALVFGDVLRLEQVILNLVTNAFKYTKSGSVKVSIRQRMLTQSSDNQMMTLDFDVSDTGIGIKESELKKIFEPFYQVENSLSAGSGLGLYIVSEIVREMGGTIECSSVVGEGSTFSVRGLEFKVANSLEIKQVEQESSKWDVQSAQKIRVLLAEDNPMNQIIIRKVLESSGFQLSVANDGQEAVDMWRRQLDSKPFSVILMDLQMPHKNGFEATGEIREMERVMKRGLQVPIVALTASTSPEEMERASATGMNEYLTKPVKKIVLENTLWKVLKSSTDIYFTTSLKKTEQFEMSGSSSKSEAIEEKVDVSVNNSKPKNNHGGGVDSGIAVVGKRNRSETGSVDDGQEEQLLELQSSSKKLKSN